MTSASADRARIAVLGSGSLARAVCYGLATVGAAPLDVFVLARSSRSATDLGHVATVRAALSGAPVGFHPVTADLAAPDLLADLFARLRPDGVLLCASTQSPWERQAAPSAWTALIERAGFGVTLPLHAELARVAGRAVAAARPRAWFLNACFPDAVNPLLAALGVPVLAGIGNVALLAAGLSAALGLADPGRLALLGHHLHLHPPERPEDEAFAWCDGAPVTAVGELLAAQRAVARPELNHITGYAAALLLRDLLAGREVATHTPGPGGLPGGYPVWLGPERVSLRLPDGVTEAAAVAVNQRWAALDGAVVAEGRVAFGPAAAGELRRLADGSAGELRRFAGELADGFAVAEIAAVTGRLHVLRDRLRQRTPETAVPGRERMPEPGRGAVSEHGREVAAAAC